MLYGSARCSSRSGKKAKQEPAEWFDDHFNGQPAERVPVDEQNTAASVPADAIATGKASTKSLIKTEQGGIMLDKQDAAALAGISSSLSMVINKGPYGLFY